MQFSIKTQQSQRGFTLLLATLTASLLLILGAAMFNIVEKQVLLSSLGRDSQFAFYAADTAAECALYWDIRYQLFSTTTPNTTSTCDGQSLGTIQFTGYGTPMTFQFEPTSGNAPYCARVSVTKNIPSGAVKSTTIDARGYSTPCAAIDSSDRALERAVEINY